jgi:hypothetical protein
VSEPSDPAQRTDEMQQVLHQKVTVLPGGKVEFTSAE